MPPTVRVIDYAANPGGGVRFTVETLRAMVEQVAARFELVSHGEALERYRALVPPGWPVTFRELPPARAWQSRTYLAGVPGAGPLNKLLGSSRAHFEVPEAAFAGCDRAWLPWVQRHRLPRRLAKRTVGSLHDLIAIEFPGVLSEPHRRDERRTIAGWLRSGARIAVSSRTTRQKLEAMFAANPERVEIVPLSGDHAPPPPQELPRELTGRPFLFTPANISPHKNHEVLLRGFARWGAHHDLVLTGFGTALAAGDPRAAELLRVAAAEGLDLGTVRALGYVDDATYYALLGGAWAVVMPTLAEGGGSFPVWEALLRGVPVVCSDIPVMREMMERVGGRVSWFDPGDPASLAARLEELREGYPEARRAAEAQVSTLQRRTWAEVASDYSRLLELA